MEQHTIDLHLKKPLHPYSFNKPVEPEVKANFNRYRGLSMHEIEQKYGKAKANYVYWMAVLFGVDLTKERIPEPSMEMQHVLRLDIQKNVLEAIVKVVNPVECKEWLLVELKADTGYSIPGPEYMERLIQDSIFNTLEMLKDDSKPVSLELITES